MTRDARDPDGPNRPEASRPEAPDASGDARAPTHAEFVAGLLPWLDGELSVAQAERMDAYAAAHPAAAERAQAELDQDLGALDGRIAAALTADAGSAADFARLLASARQQADGDAAPTQSRPVSAPAPVLAPSPVPQTHPSSQRVLRLVRPALAAAAALLMAVSLGWFYCIGPFECGYVQALESTLLTSPSSTGPEAVEAVSAKFSMPTVPGATQIGEAVVYDVSYTGAPALRRDYDLGGKTITVLLSACPRARPTFRNARELAGQHWWIADHDDRRWVAYELRGGKGVVFVVSDGSEEETLAVARAVRNQER